MAIRVRRQALVSALAATVVVLAATATTRSQQAMPPNGNDPLWGNSVPLWGGEGTFANQYFSGMNRPSLPRQGDWAEVIMANGRWMVIQNAQGQQFPVAFEAIRQYVVRWPTRLDLVSPNALVEATGIDLGTNSLSTDHVDVYEGGATSLVSPAMYNLTGANRTLTALDANQAPVYGMYMPFAPMDGSFGQRIHIVGSILGLDPLRLASPGNNWANVLPSSDGFTVTQVTTGQPSYAKKGDLVYFIPDSAGPKSLTISRLILYKKMPFRAYTGD
jgi:hypothetical protein